MCTLTSNSITPPSQKKTPKNRNGSVKVNAIVSSAVGRGFEPRSCQTKDYKIGSCCFSAKHAALKRKSKDWLARNQNTVSEWSDMCPRGLLTVLFQWATTIKIQLSVLVWYSAVLIIISLKINLFHYNIAEKLLKQQILIHSLHSKMWP